MKRLAVIDGKSVFYRGYYAMPGLATKDGTPTGGVFGFVSLAIELIKKLEPDYVAVAWDKTDTNIRKRRESIGHDNTCHLRRLPSIICLLDNLLLILGFRQ